MNYDNFEIFILDARTETELQNRIKSYLKEGWKMQGGISTEPTNFSDYSGSYKGFKYIIMMTRNKNVI